ncbi:MAG: ribosome biosynthesis protein nip7 [Stictis urceolatum]|nr:ribosome biosynthesis protein nip7 [Stictis urceolata]
MRSLTESETHTLFQKLATYTGRSLNDIVAPPADPSANSTDSKKTPQHVFRLHHSRVYYLSLPLANLATCVARPNLLSMGTCIGKFSKTGKFRMHITALDIIAPHSRTKVYLKQNGEMPLLYGGHVVKAHVGRWPDDTAEHQGVVMYNMSGSPLGFGVTARSTIEAKKMDPTGIVVFRQGDVGEYLREEDTLFAT